jgi:hypothetical protein
MSVNGSNNFLNIEDANLRVRNGSVHAQGMTIGGAIVSASHGLQSVSDTSNTTSNTLQFTNPTTAFKATSNIELTSASKIIVESNVLMDFKTLGQIEFPGSTVEQEYPPGPMDGHETLIPGHGVFCASATAESNDGTYNSYEAFDGDLRDISAWQPKYPTGGDFGTNGIATTQTQFNPGGGAALVNGPALIIQFPHKVRITSYNVYARKASDVSYLYANKPKSGRVYGSNDGSTWTHVDTFGDWTSWTANTPQTETVTTPGAYNRYALVVETITYQSQTWAAVGEWKLFGTPGPTTLDKGSLTLGRSLDVPRISRYDVDTETPRPEKLVVDFDTTVNSSPTDISGKGNHGFFGGSSYYSSADKAFILANNPAAVSSASTHYIRAELNNSETGNQYHSVSLWFKVLSGQNSSWRTIFECGENPRSGNADISLYVPGGDDKLVFAHGGSSMYTDTLTNLYFRWHHVVLTYDGANRKIYLDGALIKTQATTTWAGVANMTLHFGRNNHSNANEGCDCHVSNFKLYWQTALEPSEVQKLYRLGRTGRSMVISDTAVGIGKVPGAQLDVRGNLNVDGVITNQQRPAFYVWRDGTGNNVEAIGHGGQSRLAVTGVITNWDSKRIDTAGTFDLSNGRYYIPVSGLYMLIGAGVYRYQSGNAILEASFYVNGSNVGPRGISYNRGNTANEHHTVTITFMRFMNAGDYVQMGVPVAQSACDLYYGGNLGYFSGYLLG